MSILTKCDGCGDDQEGQRLTWAWLVHIPSGKLVIVRACDWCLEVVDNCDPVTGSYGAAACEHRRATADEIEAFLSPAWDRDLR